MNVPGNKKAVLKLMTEAEKLKKLMASNQNKNPFSIECFLDNKDVKGEMDRACFEKLIVGDLVQIEATLKKCLETSKLKLDDIYSVEIVGGSSRIPSIKALIEKVFQKTPSTMLNADEEVSRGCALMCAILSPTFKVREFTVTDTQPYPIKLGWVDERGPVEMEVFPAFHAFPFSKMLTFPKSDTIKMAAEYDGPVPFPTSHIGNFEVGEVRPTAEGDNQKVKVKVRINPNGMFGVPSASRLERQSTTTIHHELPVSSKMQGQLSFDELQVPLSQFKS